MTTLKDHQAAMVALLASGTAIPTSATRLAHALHDVLAVLNVSQEAPVAHTERRSEATTSGLNDVMLALDVAAVKPKTSPEQIIKQRDNTIRQLKDRVAKLKVDLECARHEIECVRIAYNPEYEQAGCRKEDTQLPDDGWIKKLSGKPDLSDGTILEVILVSGEILTSQIQWFSWGLFANGENNAEDIVAYRIVGESK